MTDFLGGSGRTGNGKDGGVGCWKRSGRLWRLKAFGILPLRQAQGQDDEGKQTTARAKDNGNGKSSNEMGYGSVLAHPGFWLSRLLPQPRLVLQNDKKQKQKQLWSS